MLQNHEENYSENAIKKSSSPGLGQDHLLLSYGWQPIAYRAISFNSQSQGGCCSILTAGDFSGVGPLKISEPTLASVSMLKSLKWLEGSS